MNGVGGRQLDAVVVLDCLERDKRAAVERAVSIVGVPRWSRAERYRGWIGQHDGDAGDGRVDNGYVRDATRWIGSILGAVAQVVHIGLQGVGAGLHAVDDEGSSRSEYGFGDACAQVVAAAIVIVASQLQIRPACLGAAVPDIAGDGVARRLGADDNRVAVAD